MSFRRHTTTSDSVINARYLRKQSTSSESKLWEALRNRRLDGLKFRRQSPVDRWIIDFFCLEKMAGVEVDGSVHEDKNKKEHDRTREEFLRGKGIRLFRVSAERIENDISSVLVDICNFLDIISPSPGVSQERG